MKNLQSRTKVRLLQSFLLISLSLFFLVNPAYAQGGFAVKGVIVDKTGFPLPGANVMEKGTSNGTITDLDGNFSLNVSKKGVTLTVSLDVYKRQFYDTPHGVANALLLPYVMEYNAESPAAPKYIHIAKAMGVDTTGMSEAEGVKAAVEAVKALSASINIPQKLHEINVKEEDIPALAVAAFNDVCTGGNPRPTSVADIEALYRKAF